MVYFRSYFVVLAQFYQSLSIYLVFACGLEFLQEMLLQCFMKCKAVDKTLEQCLLKEFKATCKNFGDSELKQHSDLKGTIGPSI